MKMTEEDFWGFIETHSKDDCIKLRLKYSGDSDKLKAIEQIELSRKTPEKFIDRDGQSVRPKLLYSTVSVEQSTSAPISRFHASIAQGCMTVLDMTMGMGMDAYAFCSINNADVTAIEMNRGLYETSCKNFSSLDRLKIINADSIEWLRSSDRYFDCIFIDPARRDSAGKKVYDIHDCTPDVTMILPLIMSHAPLAMIKLSPMLDITATIRTLHGVSELYVVEERGECRELLAVVREGCAQETTIIIKSDYPEFRFSLQEEAESDSTYGLPSKGDMLYEPSPAAMKAAPFKLLGRRFNLRKVAPNSHLYYGSSPAKGFPGKGYEIMEIIPYSSSWLKRFRRQWPNVSVATRNFPETAESLKAKLRVNESSKFRLMATTATGGEKVLFLLKHPGD